MANEEQTIRNVTDKPNSLSFRWGGTGDEAKVYFNKKEDLVENIEAIFEGIKKIKDLTKEGEN